MEESHKFFLQFLVSNSHPFTLGEEHAFKLFVASLQPLYKPLSRTQVKDRLMKTFIESRDKVIGQFKDTKVALTTDL